MTEATLSRTQNARHSRSQVGGWPVPVHRAALVAAESLERRQLLSATPAALAHFNWNNVNPELLALTRQSRPLSFGWPTSIPNTVRYGYQALDGKPDDVLFPQTTMTHGPAPQFVDVTYPLDDHGSIGIDRNVYKAINAAAFSDGVPINPAQ